MELVIDTSSQELKVILNEDKKMLTCERGINSKHQQHLLSEIDKVLNKSGKQLKDIDVFSLVIGPGSFTGVRLAVATIKAFSYLFPKKKIVQINMLSLLGEAIKKNKKQGNFYVFIKCTSSRCYVGEFLKDGSEKFFVTTNEEIETNISKKDAVFYGYNMSKIGNFQVENIDLTDADYVSFVLSEIKSKHFVDSNKLEPLYMALSQAEEELLKKEKLKRIENK